MRSWMVLVMLVNVFFSTAQNTYAKVSDSDPKAKVLLDKLKSAYDGYKSMNVKFELEIEIPNKVKETQAGSVLQAGSKFVAKLGDQEVYSDGATTWLYFKKNKEVQIMDTDVAGGGVVMSPKQMMTIYESGDYVYAITDERKVGTQTWVDIEFKPLKKRSEYSKLKLTIDKKANKMVYLRVFSKDGSKYTLKVNTLTPNVKYDAAAFVFNPKTVPGIHVEDLRMD
jgi:outer membrane lipoprotein-sorting protein